MDGATIDGPDVTVRPLAEAELNRLERCPWARRPPGMHRDRFAQQRRGSTVYLMAWQEERLVGHLLLTWHGPTVEPVASCLAECVELQDVAVREDLRSRGIGTRMLTVAENLARQRGARRLGIGVALDNPRARALYERLGFADSGCGEYEVGWPSIDQDGQQRWHDERCVYLVKQLSSGERAVEPVEPVRSSARR